MARKRDRVADAHQVERELKNRIHAYDQETVLPLRSRIAGLETENKRLQRIVDRLTRLERSYRAAWEAGVKLSAALLASGKDDE